MKRIFSLVLAAVILLFAFPVGASAEESNYPYYIQEYDVVMTANSDRSVDVVETLTVYYNEERRGIIREIPYEGDAEGYDITNIAVEGDEFTTEVSGGSLSIRIGNPETYVTGQKQYVIRYTLKHYADYVDEFDYLYVNLIGTQWDTMIEHVTATVYMPPDGKINQYTVTGGEYGSTETENLNYTLEDGVFKLETNAPLSPYNGITLNVEYLPGAFPDAKEWQPPYIVNELRSEITIGEQRGYRVKSYYTVTLNENDSYYLSIANQLDGTKDIKIKDYALKTTATNVSLSPSSYDSGLSLRLGSLEENNIGVPFQFEVDYEVVLRDDYTSGYDMIPIEIWHSNSDTIIEKLEVSVTSPYQIIDYITDVGRYNDEEANERITIDGGLTDSGLSMSIAKGLKTSEEFQLELNFPDGSFVHRVTIAEYLIPLGGLLLLIIAFCLVFFYKKEKVLTPPIEFYAPGGLNPAELGYVIDNHVSSRDVTSLIFYWASHDHLSIELQKKDKFTLHWKSTLDNAHPEYERTMFNKIWSMGSNGTVSSSQLEQKFYSTVSSTQGKVLSSFTGMRSLFYSSTRLLSGLFVFLALGIGALNAVIANFFGFTEESTLIATCFGLFFGLVCYLLFANYKVTRYKSSASGNIVKIIFGLIFGGISAACLTFGVYSTSAITLIPAAIGCLALTGTMAAAAFIKKRTSFGSEILERTIGFKNFLVTAERSRLEMLLEENPNYYYDILPYAQVLGVTNIWTKKFDGLLTTPPSWCYGSDPGTIITTYYMLNTLNHINRSMTSTPPSSNGGGFSGGGFSGGGGGFSGGGFSGGGSGGGGGSSW